MADHKTPSSQPHSSDEIDLGQVFQLIGKGFNSIFRTFLQIYSHLKKNIFMLAGLAVLGLAIGFGLNKIISKKLKTEVIVKPQLESKNYLYDVIDELQANIKAKDTTFFKALGIKEIDFAGLEITIARVVEKDASESDLKYLELLQSFENTDAIADILRAELQNKSSFNHRITFYYKDSKLGQEFAQKVMAYINTNPYFEGLKQVNFANAEARITENQRLLKQVDEILTTYTQKLGKENSPADTGKIVLDNQETVDVTGLFELKNELIKDIEVKKIQLKELTEIVNVINFGKPQEVQESFFGKSVVLIPSLLIGLFFLVSGIQFLNNKTKELQ